MAQRGGKRAGSGRPKGSKAPQTITREIVKAAVTMATAERVVEELALVGFSDIGDYVDERGTLLPIGSIDPVKRRALSSLKFTQYNKPGVRDGVQEDALELRMWPKLEALITLARYHGMLQDRVKVEDDRPLRDRIHKARQRLAAAVKRKA